MVLKQASVNSLMTFAEVRSNKFCQWLVKFLIKCFGNGHHKLRAWVTCDFLLAIHRKGCSLRTLKILTAKKSVRIQLSKKTREFEFLRNGGGRPYFHI